MFRHQYCRYVVWVALRSAHHWARGLLRPPTASPKNWARVYCGCKPGPTRVTLHPGRMVEVPERQPYVLWATCYDFRGDVVGFSCNKEALQLVVPNLWRKYEWRAPNRLLVLQRGDSASQAKVFKAHAVPQGLCQNLSMRSNCWRTSRKMEIAQSRVLQQAFVKEAEKALWRTLTVTWTWAI